MPSILSRFRGGKTPRSRIPFRRERLSRVIMSCAINVRRMCAVNQPSHSDQTSATWINEEGPHWQRALGAVLQPIGACVFRVWAPLAQTLELVLSGDVHDVLPMTPKEAGYYELALNGIRPGQRYYYRLNGQDYPDPASRFQA